MTRFTSPSERAGGDRSSAKAATRPSLIRGPAFGVPAAPAGGGHAGAEPIRIVDPAGEAIAWIAPGLRAGCVGFAVRRPSANAEGWVHVFPRALPPARGAQPGGAWISPILVLAEPRSDADADGREFPERPLRWRFAGRDPTAVVLEAEVGAGSPDGGRETGGGRLFLRFAARLDDAALSLSVSAANEGGAPVAIGLGLRFALTLVPTDPHPNAPPEAGFSGKPGTFVARGRTSDGASVAVRAIEGVRSARTAPPAGEGAPLLLVQGYRSSFGLEDVPPGGRTSIAASIELLDERGDSRGTL